MAAGAPADVLSLWICGGARWQHREVPLIQPRFASVLPHHAVDGQISIHEGVMEPPRTQHPVKVEVLSEEACHHHANVLMHVSRLPQLSHTCTLCALCSAACKRLNGV
jgi:hypothetical protein